MNHQRAGKRYALLLAARDLAGVAQLKTAEAHQIQRFADPPVYLLLAFFAHAQAERDVLEHGQMGEQRIALERQSHVARVELAGV